MKKYVVLCIGFLACGMCACVENSGKYKALRMRADSLETLSAAQNRELEGVLAEVNDITAGMQALREAESLLTLETHGEGGAESPSVRSLSGLRSEVQAVTEAIAGYKLQIAALEKRNRSRSAEFGRMIDNLNAELGVRARKISEITARLAAADKELAAKAEEIGRLVQDADSLGRENKEGRMMIAHQDQVIHSANYLIGTRRELRRAGVISRQGIFCPPVVSPGVGDEGFIGVDIREATAIPLNSRRARILSAHPAETYMFEAGEDGNLVLKIDDPAAFWRQTKYLVVMVGQ